MEYLPGNNSDASVSDGNVDEYVKKMTDLKKEIYKKAHGNIKTSQWRQKKYYDKRLERFGVRL